MQELDRVAAVLKPTEKMLAWINQHVEPEDTLELDDIRADCTVILLPSFDDEEDAESYLMQAYPELFNNELTTWNDDQTTWPSERTIELFLEWFDVEFHSMVYDVAEEIEMEDDEENEESPHVLQ